MSAFTYSLHEYLLQHNINLIPITLQCDSIHHYKVDMPCDDPRHSLQVAQQAAV